MIRKAVAVLMICLVAVPAVFAEPLNFQWGPYLRLRHEYWKNIFDMNSNVRDNRNFYRIKASLWASIDPVKDTTLFAKLTNESKPYVEYYAGGVAKDATYAIGEAVVDNLYFDARHLFGYPVDMRLGRQDFLGLYGEGFLIGDGTPEDGSRTFYFNAAKFSWRLDPKSTIDALAISDNKYESIFPVINEVQGKTLLNPSDEKAYGLYHKTDDVTNLHWENYYLWKHEDATNSAATPFEMQANDINTIGTFARYVFPATPWSVKGQAAYQFGTYGSENRTGLGYYGYGEGSFKQTKWTPVVGAGYLYLSGDDPATASVEAWDPLFSRHPWLSELYALSYKTETGLSGYYTNLNAIRVYATVNPVNKLKLGLTYSLMGANQNVAATTVFSGTGKDRGQLYQGRVDYTITKNITTYAILEYFKPGNFYVNSDDAIFTRVELQFKY